MTKTKAIAAIPEGLAAQNIAKELYPFQKSENRETTISRRNAFINGLNHSKLAIKNSK